ncbi:DUF2163 domain-containing protein [Qipengyuania qiaonensis]|uniref:DUF2163 domain-containing protein n=1 Tax=Qipengyuania qiaonensis TaxID=2867240 RepID=A0ABS7J2B4_9SPHN|nr:DUF2163 domain-containing protein [Qipengyuania qiaonensis]MBX7481464.1 DUF2163 domain-containing protein [Qipengyuania qiaonensis]
MSRVFFAAELDTAATWWRIYRRDGVTLGFTTHNRDLWFGGILHRAAPGMLPSAIRLTAGFEDDPGDVEGALSHASVTAADLASGRFDGARIASGVVDWDTLENALLYIGSIVGVGYEAAGFRAELASAKARLAHDPIPLTGPSCRARFCGPGCGLNPAAFDMRAEVTAIDSDAGTVSVATADASAYRYGTLRWLDGPAIGLAARIVATSGNVLTLAERIDVEWAAGLRVRLREGCDKTVATCAARFGNAVNFQGEPFLPGNDMLAQYPVPR